MKKILTFLLAVCAGAAAMAQGEAVMLPGMEAKPCVIREWENGYSLMAVYDSLGNDCLVLERQGDAYYQKVTLPTGVEVSDLRVMEGKGYVCGSTSGPDGWLGVFDIQDMLAGTLSLQVGLLSDPGKKVFVDRLMPFQADTRVEVGFVGHEMWGSTNSRALFGSLHPSSPSVWQVEFAPMSSSDITLSDICVTENYVVMGGRLGTDNRVFAKVFFRQDYFLLNEMGTNSLFASTDQTATSEPWLVALTGDQFAWAVTYDDGIGSKGSRLSAWDIDGGLTTVVPAWSEALCQGSQDHTPWRVEELAYQPLDNSVYMLQQMTVAGGASESVVLRMPAGIMGIPAQGAHYPGALLMTLDRYLHLSDCAQAMGQRSPTDHTPLILRTRPSTGSLCASNEDFTISPNNENIDTKIETSGAIQATTLLTFPFTVTKVMKVTLCSE